MNPNHQSFQTAILPLQRIPHIPRFLFFLPLSALCFSRCSFAPSTAVAPSPPTTPPPPSPQPLAQGDNPSGPTRQTQSPIRLHRRAPGLISKSCSQFRLIAVNYAHLHFLQISSNWNFPVNILGLNISINRASAPPKQNSSPELPLSRAVLAWLRGQDLTPGSPPLTNEIPPLRGPTLNAITDLSIQRRSHGGSEQDFRQAGGRGFPRARVRCQLHSHP
jgi:hypothetical protein